jgi:hypothetical protein
MNPVSNTYIAEIFQILGKARKNVYRFIAIAPLYPTHQETPLHEYQPSDMPLTTLSASL